MDKIWANRLIAGTKSWDDVPEARRNAVREILNGFVKDNTITDTRYEEITGEKHEA